MGHLPLAFSPSQPRAGPLGQRPIGTSIKTPPASMIAGGGFPAPGRVMQNPGNPVVNTECVKVRCLDPPGLPARVEHVTPPHDRDTRPIADVIASSARRALSGSRSRHVSDPQSGLEAAGGRPVRNRRKYGHVTGGQAKLSQSLQTVPDKFGLPPRETASGHRAPSLRRAASPLARRTGGHGHAARAPGAGRPGATGDTGRRSLRAGVRWRKRHKH